MLQILQLGLSIVVVTQQFLHLVVLCLFERHVVGIAAKNIFKFAFKFVNIVVSFAPKLEFHLLIPDLGFSLFFLSLVEILPQVFDDTVVVVSMLFPELAQLGWR